MLALAAIILFANILTTTAFVRLSSSASIKFTRNLMSMSALPKGVVCDIISFTKAPTGDPCNTNESADFGELLQSHKKAVVFAVPGAFTPTCSVQHLPGFIANMDAIRAKGVEAVYCLSVNDRHVMRAWAEATASCTASGISFVADGNAEFTRAMDMVKDVTGSRMGIRSMRYAAIVENGKVTSLNVDEKGLSNSSAENILKLL